ncbi:MAG: hypothetical protein ACI9K2_007602 [Myxococcota bacterium]|jgi:hypothetical protein
MSKSVVKVEGMSHAVDVLVRRMYAQVHALADSEMRNVYSTAHARWPVSRRTGRRQYPHSKGQLKLLDESDGQHRVRIVILCPALQAQGIPYAFYIKSSQNGLGGKSAWVELIRKPTRKVIRAVSEAVVEESRG